MTGFATLEEAIGEVRQGRILGVVDDEDRENEGDLVMAADKVTPEAINFMAKYGRGLVCMPMTGERLDELKISMMVSDNTAPMGTAFTVTVDARRGVTTGTSAYDRAVTIRTLVDQQMRAEDLTRPATSCPSGGCRAASCAAPATPRRPWTSRGSRVATRPASSARSSTRTAGWRGCPSSRSSPWSTASQ